VLLERLEKHAQRMPADEHLLVERVIARRAAERDDARRDVLEAYRSDRYAQLLERLVTAARDPQFSTAEDAPSPDALASNDLASVVKRPWSHLRNAVDELGDAPADEALHNVRKRAKRCRYAAEAAAPIEGKSARTFAKAVAQLQDVLGEHQDAVVARQWLAKASADFPAREAYAAGMLAGIELEAAGAAERAFPAEWKAASAKRLRSWF
jgi:CHAD domain-containing protein